MSIKMRHAFPCNGGHPIMLLSRKNIQNNIAFNIS